MMSCVFLCFRVPFLWLLYECLFVGMLETVFLNVEVEFLSMFDDC